MTKMYEIEDMKNVPYTRESWTRWEALLEVGHVVQKVEKREERRGKKRKRDAAIDSPAAATKKRCKNWLPRLPYHHQSSYATPPPRMSDRIRQKMTDMKTIAAVASPAADKKQNPKKRPPRPPYHPPSITEPPPEMPDRVRQKIAEMGGDNVIFVIEKMLFWTDTSSQHNRLSMPVNKIQRDFVTEEERRALNSTNPDVNGIEVILVEPSLRVEEVMLKKWKMKETSILYVLIKNWHYIAERNGLHAYDIVRVWSFRIGSRLCFAVVKVRDDEDDGGKGKGKMVWTKEDGASGSGSKGKEVEEDNGGGGSSSHAA